MNKTIISALFFIFTHSVQSQTYTGYFYSPSGYGMHTDSYLNLISNNDAGEENTWNIIHKDGSPVFSMYFAATSPRLVIGQYKSTNFFVNGSAGIGTTTPRGKFDVDGSGDIYLSDETSGTTAQSLFLPGHIYLNTYNGTSVSYLQARRQDNSGTTSLRIRTYDNGSLTESMHIEGNGNVGVGTITPDSKLTVKGTIHSQEVKVDLNGSVAPDYVFEKDYPLTSLEALKSYIGQNKHLPEIPSAKEMEEEGIDLKEMNLMLLKKLEEMTLYQIEMNTRIQRLEKKLTQLTGDK